MKSSILASCFIIFGLINAYGKNIANGESFVNPPKKVIAKSGSVITPKEKEEIKLFVTGEEGPSPFLSKRFLFKTKAKSESALKLIEAKTGNKKWLPSVVGDGLKNIIAPNGKYKIIIEETLADDEGAGDYADFKLYISLDGFTKQRLVEEIVHSLVMVSPDSRWILLSNVGYIIDTLSKKKYSLTKFVGDEHTDFTVAQWYPDGKGFIVKFYDEIYARSEDSQDEYWEIRLK